MKDPANFDREEIFREIRELERQAQAKKEIPDIVFESWGEMIKWGVTQSARLEYLKNKFGLEIKFATMRNRYSEWKKQTQNT